MSASGEEYAKLPDRARADEDIARRHARAVHEHRVLLDLIRAGDAVAAEDHWRRRVGTSPRPPTASSSPCCRRRHPSRRHPGRRHPGRRPPPRECASG